MSIHDIIADMSYIDTLDFDILYLKVMEDATYGQLINHSIQNILSLSM